MQAVIKHLGLVIMRCFAVLPRPLARLLARFSAWLMWRINGRQRRITETNLAISFPDLSREERTKLAKMRMYELSLSIIDHGRSWLWPVERLLRDVVRITGKSHLVAAMARGRGTIVLVPHLGDWEIAGQYLNTNYPVTMLYRQPKSKAFADFILQARQRGGARLVSAGPSGVRALLRSLSSGEIASILPDQVPPLGHGDFAPFFGEPAYTMTLVTKLLQRTGARAVCCYCKRLADRQFEIVIRPADEDTYNPDSATALAGLNRSVEQCVIDCPEQYQWQYKRYKLLPDMTKRDYSGGADYSVDGPRKRRGGKWRGAA